MAPSSPASAAGDLGPRYGILRSAARRTRALVSCRCGQVLGQSCAKERARDFRLHRCLGPPNEPSFSCGDQPPWFRILRSAGRHRRAAPERSSFSGARQLQGWVRLLHPIGLVTRPLTIAINAPSSRQRRRLGDPASPCRTWPSTPPSSRGSSRWAVPGRFRQRSVRNHRAGT